MLHGNEGGSKVTVLLYLFVLIVLFYVGIKTVPPYLHYYAMDDEVGQQLLTSSINSDDIILDGILKKAQELELPLTKDDIKLVHNDDGSISVDIKWVEVADYGYGFKREFPFELSTTTKILKE